MNTRQLQNLINSLFDLSSGGGSMEDIWAEFVEEDAYISSQTFASAQVLSNNEGVVLTVHEPTGVSQFQITIVQSR